MAKVFNNESVKSVHSLNGWDVTPRYNGARIAKINDTVGAGIALEKMGTSIPSPFARILLFNTAFQQVNASSDKDLNNIYSKLVSECIDFLEFIYLYGSKLVFKPWDVNVQLNNLQNSVHAGHKRLAKSLSKFSRDLNVKNIYLIYYNGVLVGGTSPYTLVYTSPNWHRLKNVEPKGIAGNELFADYSDKYVVPCPLYKRHEEFRKYLTNMIVANRDIPRFNDTSLRQYIFKNQNSYDQEMQTYYNTITGAEPYDLARFINDYGLPTDDAGAIVDIFGEGGNNVLYLGYSKSLVADAGNAAVGQDSAQNLNISDDYTIVSNKIPSDKRVPLVLNEAGIPNAIYVGGNPWKSENGLQYNPEEPLDQRILPGGSNIQYPYLTVSDFLEDTLIKMNYTINNVGFKTFDVPEGYLLPLKPALFEYFDINDINKKENLRFKMTIVDKNKIKATLTLPIKCKAHPYIELTKEYKLSEDVREVMRKNSFVIDVFPSYKVVNGLVPNIYSVLEHDSSEYRSLKTAYYKIDGPEVKQLPIKPSETVNRTPKTNYVLINSEIDFVCISIENDAYKAMVIPNFKEIKPNGTSHFTVGIDFGTSNTYIAISKSDGAAPEPLEIKEDDVQILTLNKIDLSEGNSSEKYLNSFPTVDYASSFDHEYAPILLGDKGDVKLPYRTVTCETRNFVNLGNPALFGNINIGFYFLKEIVVQEDMIYDTDIKWALEKKGDTVTPKQNRVKAFCMEYAWIIKNKLMLMNHPSDRFNVFLTFPHTMSDAQQGKIQTFWEDAFDLVMGKGKVDVYPVTESIAPFYHMVGNCRKNITVNSINIDIGGGTTDILYADMKNQRFFYDSSMFAGNDIWGDGKAMVETKDVFDNGFVAFFESKLPLLTEEAQAMRGAYMNYRSLVHKSEDLMNFVFSYEDKFKFSEEIKQESRFKRIFYIHLSALMYHIAQVLNSQGIEPPKCITFSGMGSKYISLLAQGKKDITMLLKIMLKEFLKATSEDGKEVTLPKDFTVEFQSNPKEVTAQGAMLDKHTSLTTIRDYPQDKITHYGFDNAPHSITYDKAMDYKDNVMESLDRFLDVLRNSEDLNDFVLNNYNVEIDDEFLNILKEEASKGFDIMRAEGNPKTTVKQSMFFWTLKNGLYEATKAH